MTTTRKVRAVKVLLLYTNQSDMHSYMLVPNDAIKAIEEAPHTTEGDLYRIEVELDFGNEFQLGGKFENKEDAIAFIRGQLAYDL